MSVVRHRSETVHDEIETKTQLSDENYVNVYMCKAPLSNNLMIYIQMSFKHFRSNNLVLVALRSNRRSNDNKYVLAQSFFFFRLSLCFFFYFFRLLLLSVFTLAIRVLTRIIDYYHCRALCLPWWFTCVFLFSIKVLCSCSLIQFVFVSFLLIFFFFLLVSSVTIPFGRKKNYSNILKNYFAIVPPFIGWGDVVAFVIRTWCHFC